MASELVSAVKDSSLERVLKYLQEHRVDWETATDDVKELLYIASGNGDDEIVIALLGSGAKLDGYDDDGDEDMNIPLEAAAKGRHTTTVQLLLKAGANPNLYSNNGITSMSAMQAAALNDDVDMMNLLLATGGSVNARNSFDATPLHVAACLGNFKAARHLISVGADINAFDINPFTPLHVACGAGLDRFADTAKIGHVAPGGLEMVKLLVEKGANIYAAGGEEEYDANYTALSFAAAGGQIEIVRYLLEKGANIDATIDFERVPIEAAAEHPKMVQFLIDNGADANYRSPFLNMTLLHRLAAQWSNPNIQASIDVLLSHGLDINAKDSRGRTVLHYMFDEFGYPYFCPSEYYQSNLCQMLIDRGADVNARNVLGNTPLHDAIGRMITLAHEFPTQLEGENQDNFEKQREQLLQIVKILFTEGANPLIRNKRHETPLQCIGHALENLDENAHRTDACALALLRGGDRSWDGVRPDCDGLNTLFLHVWQKHPEDLYSLYNKLAPEKQEKVQLVLKVLHRRLPNCPELHMRILSKMF